LSFTRYSKSFGSPFAVGDINVSNDRHTFCQWPVYVWRHVTSVGYAGGTATSPDYRSVCSGTTGHAEVVHVVFDPSVISFEGILKVFFENHDPTQGNRQGDDRGTQYRSTIYTYSDTQMATAKEAVARYEEAYGRPVTTELREAPKYYPAEDYHQQYLAKNPQGYCMHGPTGVTCPIPERVSS